eukprot:3933734-Rhodomonas_salina.3
MYAVRQMGHIFDPYRDFKTHTRVTGNKAPPSTEPRVPFGWDFRVRLGLGGVVMRSYRKACDFAPYQSCTWGHRASLRGHDLSDRNRNASPRDMERPEDSVETLYPGTLLSNLK